MKKAKDYKPPYKARWITNNPEALVVGKSELLKTAWNKTSHEVGEEGRAVALIENRDMVGAIIPADFLYEFHRKMPHLKDMDPIIHVSENDFKQNFEQYSNNLSEGASLIILDGDDKPKFAIASREFSVDITTNENGVAAFRGELAEYMFNDRFPDHDDIEKTEDIDELRI